MVPPQEAEKKHYSYKKKTCMINGKNA